MSKAVSSDADPCAKNDRIIDREKSFLIGNRRCEIQKHPDVIGCETFFINHRYNNGNWFFSIV